jgi:UDP-N-acetylmuramyl pentapeptide phosphotransferase/UDP-N-acetylglucosamine-1-phosphate transferase
MVNDLQFLIDASFVIFFVGLLDDILGLSPLKKLFGQIMASLPLVYKGGYVINNLHGFLGIGPIHEFWALGLSFLAILMFMNAFNLIDGVDGLAGSLGLMATVMLGIWFFLNNEWEYAAISACLAGSLLAFLFYNFHPAKIFMGDTGSLILGTVSSVLAIHFLKVAGNANAPFVILNPSTLIFSIFFVPLFDTLRVFAVRLVKGKSPFSADRRHIHHLLMVIGFSPRSIVFLLLGVNLFFIALTYFLNTFNSTLVFVVLFSIGIALTGWAQITARKYYNIRISKSSN